jgi:hypothetical protein
MDADSTVRLFVCRWANATADFATGGYPAEALGLRTGRFHRRWAQAGISRRYHGLCPWGSIFDIDKEYLCVINKRLCQRFCLYIQVKMERIFSGEEIHYEI